MSSVFHYDDNPLPVGNPVNLNGKDGCYELGLFDGGLHSTQYADEPEESILFQSPDGAREWLKAVTEVLTPYIETGDDSPRVHDGNGWGE